MPIKDSDAEAEAWRRAQEKAGKEREQAEDRALHALMQAWEGRQFIWWLLRIGKVGLQPFSSDPHITAFSCGELNVGQQILARIMENEPAGYFQMLKDQEDARRTSDIASGIDDSSDTPDS